MKRIIDIMLRECGLLRRNPIYIVGMVILPLMVLFFFTTLMDSGQPQEMPIGVVDLDNSSTTRTLIRKLDGFQTSNVTAHYSSVSEARHAIQRGEIYAFLYIPKGTTSDLLASRRPKISFYYTSTSITAGSLLFRDLKTVATLGSAGVGQATLRMKGMSDEQIKAFLQPIALDTHLLNNPEINYNLYLSTMLIPACLILFITMVTTYTMGQELKMQSGKKLLAMADNNMFIAIIGKMLPQTLLYLATTYFCLFYMYDILGFAHQGSLAIILLAGLLLVLSSQGFGLFMFGLMPSMRMSMSICSLWGVLSFSMVGAAFPTMAMDAPLKALSWLFPMRHYWLIYSVNVFNGYPLAETWMNICSLLILMALPLCVLGRMRKALETYMYIH